MTEEQEALLQEHGWTVECESPLEIRHEETGSFASKTAALIVVAYLSTLDVEES